MTFDDETMPLNANRPTIAFLGTGWIGRHRMAAIAAEDCADIVGICDQAPSAAADAARSIEVSDDVVVDSYEALLDKQPDGVVIATPSALHAEQAIMALERGMAVFCQKPLARTAAESARVVDAARASDRLLGVDLSYRFTTGMRRVRQVVQSGALGDVYAADLVFHNAYGPDKPWFYDNKLSGGGCVIDLGIHLVDLALWTLDFPGVSGVSSRLFSKGKPLGRDQVEDYANATLDLDSGATLRLTCSWNLCAGCDAVIAATFYGTNGGVAFHNVNGSFFDFVAEQYHGTRRETLTAPPDEWGGRAAVDWARQLAQSTAFNPEVERVVDVASALDGIYRQAVVGGQPR